MSVPPFRVRFDLPRAELERAEAEAARLGPMVPTPAGSLPFEATHLLGRLYVDVGVDLADDPILGFLKEKRGLLTDPPFTVAFDQPLAHVLASFSGAAVLALHGEGSFMISLAGDRGALGVDLREGMLDVSLPLERYAGVAPVPPKEASGAIAAAAGELARILRACAPSLKHWPVLHALERESRILQSMASPPRADTPAVHADTLLAVDEVALGRGASLVELATQAERSGAHVVPYWKVERSVGAEGVEFTPLRPARVAHTRGALARLLFPGGEATLQAEWRARREETSRLRERLKRPSLFSAQCDAEGGRLILVEPVASPRVA